jgi:RNase P subunit RPR2
LASFRIEGCLKISEGTSSRADSAMMKLSTMGAGGRAQLRLIPLFSSARGVRRREAKREAARIARELIEQAASTAIHDPQLAKSQASLARRIILKFNLRFDWRLKRFFCHGCKGFIFPGLNARVRMGPNRTLLITCTDCSYVNRKKLGARLNI